MDVQKASTDKSFYDKTKRKSTCVMESMDQMLFFIFILS